VSALAAFAIDRRSLLRPRQLGIGLATVSLVAGSVLAFGASLRALAAAVFC